MSDPNSPPEEGPESGIGLVGKVLMVVFPFLLVAVFLVIDWWMRKSP